MADTELGEPSWFESQGRSVEAWVHRPTDGRRSGAVVIAPPLAREHVVAYRSLRLLAVEAARRGRVAVRFNWSGQGESEPAAPGADLAEAWRQDLVNAIRLAQAVAGTSRVDVIGLRIGAAVAASVRDDAVGDRLLWEPVGGRAFIREHTALLKVSLPAGFPSADGGVELCGLMLDEDGARSLRALPDPGRLAVDQLPDRAWLVREQDRSAADYLYSVPSMWARTPMASLTALIDRLEPAEGGQAPPWQPRAETTVVDTASGHLVRQTFVEVGASRLPGIYSEPVDAVAQRAAALLVPLAGEAKGADRIWGPASRRLAGRGVANLRVDRRGLGDAGAVDALRDPNYLSESGVVDVADAADWLADRTGAPVTAVGACAGAWLASRASERADIHRIVMVNNRAWLKSENYYRDLFFAPADEAAVAAAPAATSSGPAAPLPPRRIRYGRVLRALRGLPHPRAPYLVRLAGSQFDAIECVERLLRSVPARTSVKVLMGAEDQFGFLQVHGDVASRRLIARGRQLTVLIDRRLDHALLSQAALDALMDALDAEFPVPVASARTDELVATTARLPSAQGASGS